MKHIIVSTSTLYPKIMPYIYIDPLFSHKWVWPYVIWCYAPSDSLCLRISASPEAWNWMSRSNIWYWMMLRIKVSFSTTTSNWWQYRELWKIKSRNGVSALWRVFKIALRKKNRSNKIPVNERSGQHPNITFIWWIQNGMECTYVYSYQ